MAQDQIRFNEQSAIVAQVNARDEVRWHARVKVEKYQSDEDFKSGKIAEVIEADGNLLMTAGATALWTKLIGGAGTVFDNTNGYIGVGDSSTAESAGQTDLQAATNKVRVGQDSTYPQVSTNTCIWKSTFGSAVGNFAWAEWAVFNAASAGTMLNRKVAALGTKASGSTWTLTVTLSLA
jgi:hypothetical protein